MTNRGEAKGESVRANRCKAAEGGGGGQMGTNGSSARLESELTGGLGCGRGMSSDDRDPWATLTGEVYWNPPAKVTEARRSQVRPQFNDVELEIPQLYASRGDMREIEDDNVLLVMKNAQLELEVQKLKAEKNQMEKKHSQEIRNRDRKELVMVLVGATCVLIYACVALIIRSFV